MRKDPRINKLQVRHREVYDAYEAVKEERISLIRTLYFEGWTVEQLHKAFNTTMPYIKRAIPEAFNPTE